MANSYAKADLKANKSIADPNSDDQSNLFVAGTTYYTAKDTFSKDSTKG